MIGLPILFLIIITIYYITKFYIKKRLDSPKVQEKRKRKELKKERKSLTLAERYLTKKSIRQDKNVERDFDTFEDDGIQSIISLNIPGEKGESSPSLDTTTISVVCPICKKSKKIFIPKSIVNESKQLTAVSIAPNIVCEHHFQAFIDKNYVVRGYQKVDYHI